MDPMALDLAYQPLRPGLTPLRLDTGVVLASEPGSVMVSLADLGSPACSEEAPLRGASSSHPPASVGSDASTEAAVQALVQDAAFISAVQGGQLHSAARAAARLLRTRFPRSWSGAPHGPGPKASSRALDGHSLPASSRLAAPHGAGRHHHHHHHHHHKAPALSGAQREALRALRQEMLAVEDAVPWGCVRRHWRTRRAAWRRQVRAADGVAELGSRVKELRASLLCDDPAMPECGEAWRLAVDAAAQSTDGPADALGQLWDALRAGMAAWLAAAAGLAAAEGEGAARGEGRRDGPRGEGAGDAAAEEAAARAVKRALAALRRAHAAGGEAALVQVPLEAVVGGDARALGAVRRALEELHQGEREWEALSDQDDGEETDVDPDADL